MRFDGGRAFGDETVVRATRLSQCECERLAAVVPHFEILGGRTPHSLIAKVDGRLLHRDHVRRRVRGRSRGRMTMACRPSVSRSWQSGQKWPQPESCHPSRSRRSVILHADPFSVPDVKPRYFRRGVPRPKQSREYASRLSSSAHQIHSTSAREDRLERIVREKRKLRISLY